MEVEFLEDGVIDWNNLLVFDGDMNNQFSDVVSKNIEPLMDVGGATAFSSIGEIENLLMNDHEEKVVSPESDQQFFDDFMADILVDSPASEVVSDGDKGSKGIPSDEEKDKEEEEEKEEDPVARKLRRQLRNRDAAVRSRERKKMYVKELEMKSRYLEGECRRLGRLLHCVIADNQALRLALGNTAFGVTSAKQESAVLLLESLLLGSLLWFLGIMCLFNLPTLPRSILVADPLENVGERVLNKVAPRGERSKMYISPRIPSLVASRRCKASRTRMRPRFYCLRILV